MIRRCLSCGSVWYNRSLCFDCGDVAEDVFTIESVIVYELINIILNSKLPINYSVVQGIAYDGPQFEIRIWTQRCPSRSSYRGHVFINGGDIYMHRASLLGKVNVSDVILPIADPLCFQNFEKLLVIYLDEHQDSFDYVPKNSSLINDEVIGSHTKPEIMT